MLANVCLCLCAPTQIVVAPPYEACVSLHGDDAAAARVKKVLDAERQRLQAAG